MAPKAVPSKVKAPGPAKAPGLAKAPGPAPATNVEMRSFVGVFPYTTAWATVGNLILLSIIVIAGTMGYYMQDSAEDFTPALEQIKEIGKLFAVAFRHREYYQGRPSTVARGVNELFEYAEKKKEILDAKKKYYSELFNSGLKAIAGWQSNGEHRYYISKGKKTWHNAQKFCMDRNAHLASIHSTEEQSFITSQLHDQAWIGLNDEDEEGRWRWSDDSWFTTQYWADGEPSDAESRPRLERDCASIAPSASTYNWKDDHCDQLHQWVCKQFRPVTRKQ